MKQKLEKIAKYVTDILLFFVGLAIVIALYSLIELTVLHKNYVNYFGYTAFVVESGSMEPSIHTKDMIIVKIGDNYKVNDVITYYHEGSFITHRIIKKGKNNLLTKGDSNDSEDKLVSKDKVIGKVVKILPKYGLWKEVALSPIVLIVIFATLIVLSLGFSYNGKKRKKEQFKEYLESDNLEDVKEINEIKKEIKEEIKEQIKEQIKEEIPEKDDSIIYFPFFNEDYTYELRNKYINQGKTVFDYFLPEYYLYKKGFLVVPQKTEKVYNKSAFKIKYSTPGDYRVYLQFDNYYSISYKYVNISFNKYDDVKEYIIHVEE